MVPDNVDDAKSKLEALSNLAHSDGWRLFDAYLSGQQNMLQIQLFSAQTPHEMAVITGRLSVVLAMRSWPKENAELARNFVAGELKLRQQSL